MTLKQTITNELLESVDNSIELEEIFRRYSRSKGPFYLGLADATSELWGRLKAARQQTAAAEEFHSSLKRDIETLAEQRDLLEEQVQSLAQQVQDGESKTAEVRGLLDHAEELTQWGFGEPELCRLKKLLAQVAADQGAPPEEGVAQFFDTVTSFGEVISFDLEARRAQTRAQTAIADG